MLAYLVVLLTVVPIFELYVLIKVGQFIGALNTVLVVLLTGIAGAILAKLQGLSILRRIQEDLLRGIMPAASLLDGLFILSGGILLITPGFITDCLGLLFLVPMTRDIFKRWLKKKFRQMIDEGQTLTIYRFRRF
jgi:UPF0716 protein FxsA